MKERSEAKRRFAPKGPWAKPITISQKLLDHYMVSIKVAGPLFMWAGVGLLNVVDKCSHVYIAWVRSI